MILAILFALEFGAVVEPGWVRYRTYIPPPPGAVYYTEFNAEVIALDVLFLNTTLIASADQMDESLLCVPPGVTFVLASDHERSRAQDREFIERLVITLRAVVPICGRLKNPRGTNVAVNQLHQQIRGLIAEWEKRNE